MARRSGGSGSSSSRQGRLTIRASEALLRAASGAATQVGSPSRAPVETRHGVCNLCEALCGLEFKVQGGKVVKRP